MFVILGLFFHALGGFAAGSFYLPFKLIKTWKWETAWFVLGVAAWIITPILMAWITVPNLIDVLFLANYGTKIYTFLFGVLWGIGGLTFGLSMRFLGMSLGTAVSLGFTAAFGTLIPPIYNGRWQELLQTKGGQFTLIGVFICLVGIAVAGKAGMLKEKELSSKEQKETVAEFNLRKGVVIAIISGVLSSCFAFGLQSGKPIADLALSSGAIDIFQNNAILVWILWGGFATNFIWTSFLNIKNKTFTDLIYKTTPNKSKNYLLAAAGGITWYFQFFLYGMGTTFLGEEYEFASWTIHVSFILLFSTAWGLYFKEWKGVSTKTMRTLWGGLSIIVLSALIIGAGNYIE
ncbi:L-rhamnose/proton symporter RhaT [Autumnicola edwardsiae]|uniref:L-rhamnose/proton symporter RhaT n=1 Tax=Autumnicola edwardsiae TaxID=3075594 RepID=A0ABU3CZG4_9FLAO|nr:L-rhamnose/proton symporter RhaT [Zunongwangia sp. F297]MDT0651691.1 L-rhamnose/proton symporter RhaT [Zunongwangia sp. F297]